MIELFLKAIDRLIDLVRIGEKRAKARYDEIYKPSFIELQSVHGDYLSIISQFTIKVKAIPDGATNSNKVAREAFNFLAERRLSLVPVREKLLAFRSLVEDEAASKLPQLEKDFLWSLVLYFQNTEIIQNEDTTFTTDLLYKLASALEPISAKAEDEEDFDEDLPKFTLSRVRNECDHTIDCLERSWNESVVIFNKLRLEITRKTS